MIRASRPDVPQQVEDDWEVETGFDLGHIARLLFWGVLAVSSLAGAFLAARTDLGSDRVAAAWNAFLAPPHKPAVASATQPAQAPQPSPAASAPAPVQGAVTMRQPPAPPVTSPAAPPATVSTDEVQALSARVQALAADRDRLAARIEAVEQSLDVTGSIGKSMQGDPAVASAWSAVPLPTGRTGYAPFANMPPFTPEPVTEWAVTKTEFGIDLGAAPTLDGIRSQWAAVRAQHAALMDGLRPAVAIREVGRTGHELRLIVGPFTNAAYAARICVVLSKSGRECRATTFEGQRLAAR